MFLDCGSGASLSCIGLSTQSSAPRMVAAAGVVAERLADYTLKAWLARAVSESSQRSCPTVPACPTVTCSKCPAVSCGEVHCGGGGAERCLDVARVILAALVGCLVGVAVGRLWAPTKKKPVPVEPFRLTSWRVGGSPSPSGRSITSSSDQGRGSVGDRDILRRLALAECRR